MQMKEIGDDDDSFGMYIMYGTVQYNMNPEAPMTMGIDHIMSFSRGSQMFHCGTYFVTEKSMPTHTHPRSRFHFPGTPSGRPHVKPLFLLPPFHTNITTSITNMGGSSSKSVALPPSGRATDFAKPQQQQEDEDQLRDGPCAATFALLEKCQQEKRIVRHDRALTACVSETDLLIKCIHRNPAYFQNKK